MLEQRLASFKQFAIALLFLDCIILFTLFFTNFFFQPITVYLFMPFIGLAIVSSLILWFIISIKKLSDDYTKKIDTIFNNISAILVVTDGKNIIKANKSFLNFFGLNSLEEFIKDHNCICDTFIEEEGYLTKNPTKNENWLEYLMHYCDKLHKAKIEGADGKVHIFQVNFQSYFEDEEKKYIVSFEDITQLEKEMHLNKKKDQQLIQQARFAQMGEMIAMIAHQWRQPLNAITATVAAIELKTKIGKIDTATTLDLIKKINSYAKHLSHTIDDFRDFFKTNKELTNTSTTEIVECAFVLFKDIFEAKGFTIKSEIDHIELTTYHNEIKQVLLNLFKNAEDILIEKNIPHPSIYIKAYQEYHFVVFEVCDNAGGIDDDIIKKIFDPYFSTKTKKDGTGLGLYMSKIIVEQHCYGKIKAYNSHHGACFKISLPQKVEI